MDSFLASLALGITRRDADLEDAIADKLHGVYHDRATLQHKLNQWSVPEHAMLHQSCGASSSVYGYAITDPQTNQPSLSRGELPRARADPWQAEQMKIPLAYNAGWWSQWDCRKSLSSRMKRVGSCLPNRSHAGLPLPTLLGRQHIPHSASILCVCHQLALLCSCVDRLLSGMPHAHHWHEPRRSCMT